MAVMLERSPEGMTLRELTLILFLSCGVDMGEGEMTPYYPFLGASTAGRRIILEVLRARKLVLPLTYCSPWESGPVLNLGSTSGLASPAYGGCE